MPRVLVSSLLVLVPYLLIANFLTVNAEEVDDTWTDPGEATVETVLGDESEDLGSEGLMGRESWLEEDILTSDKGTLYVANKLGAPRGAIMKFPWSGPLSVWYEGLDEPEGMDVDPTTGDLIVLNNPYYGSGSIYRVLADGSGGYRISSSFGAKDDIFNSSEYKRAFEIAQSYSEV